MKSARILLTACLMAATLPVWLLAGNTAAEAPIGVFDSGLGGLTVLERLLDMDRFDNSTGSAGSDGIPDFAAEGFQYFGDQANMPYGDYSSEGRSELLKELIWNDARFLLGDKFYRNARESSPQGVKPRVKILVIACNTATAWGLSLVRERLSATGDKTKVVGVIEAGVRAALDGLSAGPDSRSFAIGVLATPGTIASGAYERTLRTELAARGVTNNIVVLNQGCAGLADAVEAGSPAADAIAWSNMVSLVEKHGASGFSAPLRAVILGCTHYPFVQKSLERAVAELRAKGAVIAEDFRFVDPAVYTAVECYRLLREQSMLVPGDASPAPSRAFLSVANPELDKACLDTNGQLRRSYKYGRAKENVEATTRPIPFTRANFGDAVFTNVARLLPRTAEMLASADEDVVEYKTP